jgi:hypothetical protein
MKLLKMVNPITVTKGAFGLAGTAVGVAETVVRGTAQAGLHLLRASGEQIAATEQPEPAVDDTDPAAAVAGDDSVTDVEGAPPGPNVVAVEPHVPEQPPIDVVGQALAAEAALGDRVSPEGAGVAHEPRGASRDEEHGDAALQRAEVEGIADEVAAVLEGDVEPEIGPDEHLTEPVIDPAEAKAVISEMEMSRRAADPHKG